MPEENKLVSCSRIHKLPIDKQGQQPMEMTTAEDFAKYEQGQVLAYMANLKSEKEQQLSAIISLAKNSEDIVIEAIRDMSGDEIDGPTSAIEQHDRNIDFFCTNEDIKDQALKIMQNWQETVIFSDISSSVLYAAWFQDENFAETLVKQAIENANASKMNI
jgi:hypothetical protein